MYGISNFNNIQGTLNFENNDTSLVRIKIITENRDNLEFQIKCTIITPKWSKKTKYKRVFLYKGFPIVSNYDPLLYFTSTIKERRKVIKVFKEIIRI